MSKVKHILADELKKVPLPQPIKKILGSSGILDKFTNLVNYEPKVGVMGKSGAGKSSLINAILGKNHCKVGSVGGCTRAFQEERLAITDERYITFMDLPGISENKERHEEYLRLYREKLTELDTLIWVIKIDDRANRDDEEFYQWLIDHHYPKERIIFVLSQSDKADPSSKFDYQQFKPSDKQRETISANRDRIINDFNVSPYNVIPLACNYDEESETPFKYWNIDTLLQRVMTILPKEAKSSFYSALPEENRSNEIKTEAKTGFIDSMKEIAKGVVDEMDMPHGQKSLVKKIVDVVATVAKKLWSWLF